MWTRDYGDIAAGGFFLVCGLAAAAYAALNYPMGTFRAIGPGMFPTCVGLVMAGFGAAILLPAFRRSGRRPVVETRAALAVLAAVAAFAAAVPLFGLVPATAALTLVAGLAEPEPRPRVSVLLAVVLSALAWAIFIRGLAVPVPALRWPY